jgi:hypothetical protein
VKIVCAWCAEEGRPALIGEKEPMDDPDETLKAATLRPGKLRHAGVELRLGHAPKLRRMTAIFAPKTKSSRSRYHSHPALTHEGQRHHSQGVLDCPGLAGATVVGLHCSAMSRA